MSDMKVDGDELELELELKWSTAHAGGPTVAADDAEQAPPQPGAVRSP